MPRQIYSLANTAPGMLERQGRREGSAPLVLWLLGNSRKILGNSSNNVTDRVHIFPITTRYNRDRGNTPQGACLPGAGKRIVCRLVPTSGLCVGLVLSAKLVKHANRRAVLGSSPKATCCRVTRTLQTTLRAAHVCSMLKQIACGRKPLLLRLPGKPLLSRMRGAHNAARILPHLVLDHIQTLARFLPPYPQSAGA